MPAVHSHSPVRHRITEETPQTGVGDGDSIADINVTRLDETSENLKNSLMLSIT